MLNKKRTYKPISTAIADAKDLGRIYRGYIVPESECKGCPYWTVDLYGNMACYTEEFKECEFRPKFWRGK